MLELLWLVPALPFAGFLKLILVGTRLSRTAVALTGVSSVGASAAVSIAVAVTYLVSPPPHYNYTQTLWTWVKVNDFMSPIGFYLDPLSLVMVLVVTVVGFLIHLYSVDFMAGEEGYSRFFAYMNLFVGSMLTLLLADNLLLLYLGWEGVGLCSYLLIGFWYKDPANGRAALKAFVVTRVGDAAMAVGLFLLFTTFGTLQIQEVMQKALQEWPVGSTLAVAAAALLLGGAVGKSAQLPLQTWLPDAMAGPTPVSALIHAATMVTAGVYLIARTHVLFTLAPAVQHAVAIIGAATLLLAAVSALTQRDIKRVLAYSTISQIGYMFLALGVGAWSAAIFHFMTHAFFKALLFLGAGVIILSLEHEHDLFKMGGLRKELSGTFWSFLIGSASLSALPLVTAGFYSKELILWHVWSSETGSLWLWAAGLLGALLTSVYTFRMVFLAFFGASKGRVTRRPGKRMLVPLFTLALFSVVSGFIELPETLGNLPLFSEFLQGTFSDASPPATGVMTELMLQITAGTVSIIGVLIAYVLFLRNRQFIQKVVQTVIGNAVHCFLLAGWGFDALYDALFVRPFVRAAEINKNDFIDFIYRGIALLNKLMHYLLSRLQTGMVRWYAAGIGIGAIITIGFVVLT